MSTENSYFHGHSFVELFAVAPIQGRRKKQYNASNKYNMVDLYALKHSSSSEFFNYTEKVQIAPMKAVEFCYNYYQHFHFNVFDNRINRKAQQLQ